MKMSPNQNGNISSIGISLTVYQLRFVYSFPFIISLLGKIAGDMERQSILRNQLKWVYFYLWPIQRWNHTNWSQRKELESKLY